MVDESRFEWDDAKSAINARHHAIDFIVATLVFDDPHLLIVETIRPQDREDRFKAIGLLDGLLTTVVFTMRNGNRRLISARRSNPPERRLYGDR